MGKLNFSFFSNRWGSGTIQGKQISEKLGAKLEPESDYENDVCIFVKRTPFVPFPKHSYLDVIDNVGFLRWLKDNPTMGVITFTKPSQHRAMEYLNRSDIVYIPQHHCNFERKLRPSREVKTVGFIGSKTILGYDIEEAKKLFSDIGLNLTYVLYPSSRRGVVHFYKSIDIQICFRPAMKYYNFKDSLKIVNAGSYGIPTVAFPETNNELEFKNCYVPVRSFYELVAKCWELKNDLTFYNGIAKNVLAKAEPYHIDTIISYYYKLGKENEV